MTDIEGAQGAYARIQSKKTLKEILEVASSFEESARNFYRDLIPKVSKNVRWVVEELAQVVGVDVPVDEGNHAAPAFGIGGGQQP